MEAEKPLYKTIGSQNLAVINCCEHEFSIATDKNAGANPLNPIRQFHAIQEAKQKADYVLVIVHGGHEHYQLPSVRMQETYRFFIDAGADAIVNHHQHCYSGYEVYCGKPIFYGLGNFCFDESGSLPDSWYNGYLVVLDFHEEKVNYRIYPYVQCKENATVSLLHDRTEFDKSIAVLNDIIADPQKLRKANDEYYSTTVKNFMAMYQPYENRILNKLYRMHLLPSLVSKKKFLRILNYIDCETHRDKQLFALKKIVEK